MFNMNVPAAKQGYHEKGNNTNNKIHKYNSVTRTSTLTFIISVLGTTSKPAVEWMSVYLWI